MILFHTYFGFGHITLAELREYGAEKSTKEKKGLKITMCYISRPFLLRNIHNFKYHKYQPPTQMSVLRLYVFPRAPLPVPLS